MANLFYRQAIPGADDNSWAVYVLALEKNAIGDYKSYIFDDSGTLKVTEGRIGISDGTNEGVSIIDTETTISLAGVSNSNWAKIEMTVSGSAVTFTATDITGTDPDIIPTSLATAWSPTKGGYYILSTARVIGLVYKDSGGALGGVINVKDGVYGYYGKVFYTTAQDQEYEVDKNISTFKKDATLEIGDWNMDTDTFLVVSNPVFNYSKIRDVTVMIKDDADTKLLLLTDSSPTTPGAILNNTSAEFRLSRTSGGIFDNTDYDSTSFNRGWIYLELTE